MKNKIASESQSNNFEIELLKALKSYGFLFPSSLKGVDRFEELYGRTEIELPDQLKSSENILRENEGELIENINFRSPIRRAALVLKDKGNIGLSAFLTEDEITDLNLGSSGKKRGQNKQHKKK